MWAEGDEDEESDIKNGGLDIKKRLYANRSEVHYTENEVKDILNDSKKKLYF